MTSPPVLEPGYTTPEMSALWTATARVEAILTFEAALAMALADAGIAPLEDAALVASACAVPLDDHDAAWSSTWDRGTPMLAILDELGARIPDGQRRWLHHGATTQDAVDSAHMMQAVRSLSILETGVTRIATHLLTSMETHRAQPQTGRTFLQHARPTTFGMRCALWLDGLLSRIEEGREVRAGLPVQLGGPVGDRAEYGAASQQVVEALAARLGLAATPLAWQGDRGPVWKLVGSVDRFVRSLAKIATDIAILASSDVAEVEVRAGGSSSMGDKRNPLDAIRAISAAGACRGAVAMIDQGPSHELDRGIGSWHLEWFSLPIVFQTAAAVVSSVERLLESLVVDAAAMSARVESPVIDTAAIDGQIDAVAARFRHLIDS
jgi:3-carboxy-cis,cis-muconate cycloisomerase